MNMTTIEKKAEESYKTNIVDKNIVDLNIVSVYVRGYIAGAKENGMQWHDLRKNPKDLPPVYETVLDDKGEECFYVKVPLKKDVFVGKWKYYDINGDEWEQEPPIAWCEKPQFKE